MLEQLARNARLACPAFRQPGRCDTSARIDALLAQMAERSLRISTLLLARKLGEQEKAPQLDTLQLELSQLRVVAGS